VDTWVDRYKAETGNNHDYLLAQARAIMPHVNNGKSNHGVRTPRDLRNHLYTMLAEIPDWQEKQILDVDPEPLINDHWSMLNELHDYLIQELGQKRNVVKRKLFGITSDEGVYHDNQDFGFIEMTDTPISAISQFTVDIVIGNPPWSDWAKFFVASTKAVVDGGYVCMVLPSNWKTAAKNVAGVKDTAGGFIKVFTNIEFDGVQGECDLVLWQKGRNGPTEFHYPDGTSETVEHYVPRETVIVVKDRELVKALTNGDDKIKVIRGDSTGVKTVIAKATRNIFYIGLTYNLSWIVTPDYWDTDNWPEDPYHDTGRLKTGAIARRYAPWLDITTNEFYGIEYQGIHLYPETIGEVGWRSETENRTDRNGNPLPKAKGSFEKGASYIITNYEAHQELVAFFSSPVARRYLKALGMVEQARGNNKHGTISPGIWRLNKLSYSAITSGAWRQFAEPNDPALTMFDK
jgi:hypothetical protein